MRTFADESEGQKGTAIKAGTQTEAFYSGIAGQAKVDDTDKARVGTPGWSEAMRISERQDSHVRISLQVRSLATFKVLGLDISRSVKVSRDRGRIST